MDKNTSRNKTRKFGVRRASTRKHMKKLYEGMTGYGVNTAGYDPKFAVTYGEIVEDGFEKLLRGFNDIQDISSYPPERRTFYDLGSGIGKTVYAVASLMPEIKTKGVEMVKDRHNVAMVAYNNIQNNHIKKRIEFINASLFDINVSDAAWIFISNLCFKDETNKETGEKLAKELAPNSIVAVSKSIPFPSDTFIMIKRCDVPMTWDANHQLYMYKKLETPTPAVTLSSESYTFPVLPKVDLPTVPSPY